MKNVFLDTNVILDFLGERAGFYEPAARILTLADLKKIKIYTSAVSIANTYYLLAKYENHESAIEKIRKFNVLCTIATTDDEVLDKAINSNFKDFEDSIQYFSAIASGCNLIITRNEKDFKHALIPVMNPIGFLQSFKNS